MTTHFPLTTDEELVVFKRTCERLIANPERLKAVAQKAGQLPIYTKTMTEEQIETLRWLIKKEIDAAAIDGMEHGAWGWAEKQLDESWKEFQKTFKDQ